MAAFAIDEVYSLDDEWLILDEVRAADGRVLSGYRVLSPEDGWPQDAAGCPVFLIHTTVGDYYVDREALMRLVREGRPIPETYRTLPRGVPVYDRAEWEAGVGKLRACGLLPPEPAAEERTRRQKG